MPSLPTPGGSNNTWGQTLNDWLTKGGREHNVKDGYLATGNGSTDDYTAINNALTAGAGSIVHFPAGTYLFQTALAIPANTTVTLAPGVILKPKLSGGVNAITVGNGSALIGYGFGSGQAQINVDSTSNINSVIRNTATDGTQEYYYVQGLYITATTGATVSGAGIEAAAVFTNSGIRDCVIAGNNVITNGILIRGTSSSHITPFYVRDIWVNNTTGNGIVLTDNNPPSGTGQVWMENITSEHQASGFHGLYIKGFSFGGFRNIVLRGYHYENSKSFSAAGAAIYIDHPNVGFIADDISMNTSPISNKKGIWIASGTQTKNIHIKNVYNDSGVNPALLDDFNTVTFGAIDVRQYALPPRCRAYHNTTQTLTTGTLTALNLNSERYDTDGMHDNVTNNTRVTCVTPGVYTLIGNVEYASNAAGARMLALRINGTNYIARQYQPAVNGDVSSVCVSADYQMAAGDYVELIGFQSSGGNLNSTNGVEAPSLSANLHI